MRVLLGVILGAALTIGVAFVHDTWATGPTTADTGATTVERRAMVNWNVVGENWSLVQQRMRETWTALSHKVTS